MINIFLPLALLLVSQNPSAADELLGHLKPFGQQGPISPIQSVDGFISPDEFLNNYALQNRPLLFRGAAKASPAFEKWTDEYLSETTPPRPAGDVFIEHNKKENRSQSYSFVHFKEFLRIYNTSNIYMVSEVPSHLLDDLIVPYPLQCRFFVQGGLDTHVAWFSSGGTSSVIHYDSYENINCLLRGRKSLVFVNTTRFSSKVARMIDKQGRGYSSVDVDSIDIKTRPEFSGLEFHSAEMQAGDCLYIPNLWVHQVRSSDNNLAVNLWWFQRKSYDIGGCGKVFDKKLRFSRVRFAARMNAARNDATDVREVLATHLSLPATQADFASFLSRGEAERLASDWPEFSTTVAALFTALDTDGDGQLSKAEFKKKLKLKAGVAIKNAVTAYNVQVFAMHEAAAKPDDLTDRVSQLPKLLATSDSGEDVFAPERTWQPRSRIGKQQEEPDEDEKVMERKDEL